MRHIYYTSLSSFDSGIRKSSRNVYNNSKMIDDEKTITSSGSHGTRRSCGELSLEIIVKLGVCHTILILRVYCFGFLFAAFTVSVVFCIQQSFCTDILKSVVRKPNIKQQLDLQISQESLCSIPNTCKNLQCIWLENHLAYCHKKNSYNFWEWFNSRNIKSKQWDYEMNCLHWMHTLHFRPIANAILCNTTRTVKYNNRSYLQSEVLQSIF